jgi:acetyl-CoA acetyltransferase
MTDVHIVGAGIHPFVRSPGLKAIDLGLFALRQALADATVDWPQVQFVFGGSMDGGNADSILRYLQPTGVQVINIINGCATGGSSLLCAYWAIRSGEFDLGIALGYDKHAAGAFNRQPSVYGLPNWYAQTGLMVSAQFFGMKIRRYMELHGISAPSLGRVVEKAFANGALTPHAWRREPLGHERIMNAPLICDPLTKFMFCSPGEGGVALVLMSDRKMRELGLRGPRVRGAAVRTRTSGSFDVYAPMIEISRGDSPTTLASRAAFEMAAVAPAEISVAQLQDTDAGAEIMHLAECGFCADGEQEGWLNDGVTTLTGRLPVNTDGGCLACGEPIGASGLRQVYENVQQLRGRAGARQIANTRLGFSQVYGAPGISSAVILEAG